MADRNQHQNREDWNNQSNAAHNRSYEGNAGYNQNYDRQQGYGNSGRSRSYGQDEGNYNRVNYVPDNNDNRSYGSRDYESNSGSYGNRAGSYSTDYGYNRDNAFAGHDRNRDFDRHRTYGHGEFGGYEQRGERGYGSAGNTSGLMGIHRGKGPKGYQRSETRIREDVCERLTDDDRVDASDIDVQVQGNEVILTGTVRDREEKRRAEYLVETISGVRHVENRIRVGGADEIRSDRERGADRNTSGTLGTHDYTGNTDRAGGIGTESGTTNEIIRNVHKEDKKA